MLLKSNCNDLSFTQICKSTIPEDWKDWMNVKLMNTDARPPDESFRKSFTQYLKGLQLTTPDSGSTVMSVLWCHPGKTGILGLLLCLYWQAEYSGARKNWEGNVKWVESIFNNILISNMKVLFLIAFTMLKKSSLKPKHGRVASRGDVGTKCQRT